MVNTLKNGIRATDKFLMIELLQIRKINSKIRKSKAITAK